MKRITNLFFVLLASTWSLAQTDSMDWFEQATSLAKQGNYAEAFKLATNAAEQGDIRGYNLLGDMYYVGKGVPKNDQEAVKWYCKAAEQGDATAQNHLGKIYFVEGVTVTKNYIEALKWSRMAAEQGNAEAQQRLGAMYQLGLGVYKDYQEAMKWYRKAAEQGNAEAQRCLGTMYRLGFGVRKSLKEAAMWYQKAADQGYELAKSELEHSVPKRYRKAAAQGADVAQESRNSEAQGVKEAYPSKLPNAFPRIDISNVCFSDEGNSRIDGGERCAVKFRVTNSGKGLAQGCVGIVKIEGAQGITAEDVKLPAIAPGQSIETQVNIVANMGVKDGTANLEVSVTEPNGFGCDPIVLEVETKAFMPPKVLVADYSVTGSQGSMLAKRTPFDLQVLVQNAAHGVADDVQVSIALPANVFLLDGDQQSSFAHLGSNETQSMVYSLIVNNNYASNTIPVTINLKEKHGKYAESRTISLNIDQPLAQNKIEVKGIGNATQGDIALAQIAGGTKQADVDSNIPQAKVKAERTFAIVIANENYKREESVRFAANDGRIMKQYLTQALGLPETNVRVAQNATLNEMREELGWLKSVAEAYNGDINIVFYYAGHGMPDEATGKAYLIPCDGNGQNVATCLALNDIYEQLMHTNARQVCVFLDACFSGSLRGDGMLVAARGVAIKAKQDAPQGKMVVFSAAQGDETAYPYTEKGHGLFTYYLLKKLQDTKGEVTLGELGEYIHKEVRQRSVVVNSKSQTPTMSAPASLGEAWKNWKLK